jgi:hypothetical protein
MDALEILEKLGGGGGISGGASAVRRRPKRPASADASHHW